MSIESKIDNLITTCDNFLLLNKQNTRHLEVVGGEMEHMKQIVKEECDKYMSNPGEGIFPNCDGPRKNKSKVNPPLSNKEVYENRVLQ